MTLVFFWIALFIIFYTYIGYGIVLYILVKLFREDKVNEPEPEENTFPRVSIVIAAYNEKDFILEKVKNLKAVHYPEDRIELVFVTDGSDDGTNEVLSGMEGITLYHKPERKGKTAAINRIMPLIKSEITIFNDANTLINPDAVRKLVRHFIESEQVGAVAGEKRILTGEYDQASSAGEGFYWKYESFLKKLDSKLYSVVGAAGELFAVRTPLYNYPGEDIIIEDFVVTLKIARDGYVVKYEPEAYAMEKSSVSVKEELKRKIRIAAGGIQSLVLLRSLFNILRYGWLSFQFISHRALRWSLTPLLLPVVIILNAVLYIQQAGKVYTVFFYGQFAFYLLALIGYLLQARKIKLKIFFIPYYFLMMNFAVYAGFIRYIKGSQSAIWERAKRAE